MNQIQRTVLIVDRSPEDCHSYRQYLLHDREYQYKIIAAPLGQEGLTLWEGHQPDLVLLDYRLPDMDGLEFIAQLRSKIVSQRYLPVIVVGVGNETIAVQAIKAGAQDYLIKEQIAPESLRLAVNGTIDKAQLHAKLQANEERLHLALKAACMGTWEWQIPNNCLVWSDLVGPLFGLPAGTSLASYEDFIELVHPEDRESVNRAVSRTLETGINYEVEFRTVWADGSLHWIGGKGQLYYDWRGQPLRLLGTVVDLTLSKQAEAERLQQLQRERAIALIAQQVHQSLDLERVLQTTVDEVRHFLDTDRAIVFRLQADGGGTVVAESVGTPWRSILASQIYDPCLASSYLEPYRQGLVTAKTDIRDGSIDPCHVQLLDQFEVRANLVVPILHENQCWGLLIVHHCAAPRLWQPLEIDLLQQLTQQVSIAIRQAELYQQAQRELQERKRTEAILRDSEERFRQLAENIDAVFWISDYPSRRVIYVSPAYERLWGLNPQCLYDDYRVWKDFVHPEHRESNALAFQEKALEGKFDREYRIVLPDRTVRWVRDRCFPVKDEAGRIYRFTGIAEDITDRKQAEIALQESQREFATLAEASPAAIFRFDINNNCLYVNRRWSEMTGRSIEEALGMGWLQSLHPEECDRLRLEWLQWCQKPEPRGIYQNEGRHVHPDGSITWYYTQCLPYLDSNGTLTGYVGTLIDITDRKQAEEKIRQSEERYRYLAESIPQLIWTANVEGVLLDVNQRWLDFTGLTLGQAQAEGWPAVIHPDDVSMMGDRWMCSQQDGSPYQAEGRMRGCDGVYRWFLHQAIPFKNESDRVVKWFGTATDIEDQKCLEEQRDNILQQEKALRAAAEKANRAKDEFLAVLSHELRSPLNPILGWTQLLQSQALNAAQTAKALDTIERNAKLQTQLIDDLLDIAGIMHGKMRLNAVPVNLSLAVESAIDTVKSAAAAKSIEIHPVLPDLGLVLGDAVRLQQIVWNLLSNAIKFTPNGGTVEIRLERSGVSGALAEDRALIAVSDTGKGIHPDFLLSIFDSFYQEDVSLTRKYGGLGLGLAIVRHLVEAHGGTIAAESAGENLGATFKVFLPLLNPEPEMNLAGEVRSV
ncbi:MAG: PAS domain-containing protein [Microcoleus sp. PH2017_10_PVI_O_A]|uniref:PAS domain-containing protein n=1 Tax=unclassified Microcoleus TaxID=2642155 RepID=UPI001D4A81BB|nr:MULTISPECIES: PAS domain-containing protein [unclassified Microcoleus]TAE79404.1 MAG: PAS domain S-box protein [Oscillatoriales cyanobacterium]MCC3404442.1 PAS domain-containing protein [Microcoleus sp. PH2017_10_PVI_O_A]MCC3458530.1 PAS domain-containing protein [Microcoleus sp. PH2017_11_PCY_U_A]MCC3477212.1 PAS domain-containing protein [Microcoleus sp. PH2017_12_PCY_D_A]MCC3529897.1 PAS domain-containing protein [Microcoleus sp. PH2017_21_RUC_O_A]